MSYKSKGLGKLNKKDKSIDNKLLFIGLVIIVLVFIIAFSLFYFQQSKESEIRYHYDIPILDENRNEVGGVHIYEEIPIENVSVTLINMTAGIGSSHDLSEKVFICKNTSFMLEYVDDNNDGLFNRGDKMYVSGQTDESMVKFIHSNGKVISSTTFWED